MSENSNNLPSYDTNNAIEGLTSSLGIPDPVQRGFLKAANRLLGALTDIPAAWFESFADDVRSTSEARRVLKLEAAKELAEKFGGKSDLANRAFAQHVSKILGEQINLEDIVGMAAHELANADDPEEPKSEPGDDWLNTFRTEAGQKSSSEMKLAYGRLLAGEIRNPGTFSIKAVRTLGMMDQTTAELFRFLCSMALNISLIDEVRVLSLGGNAGTNALSDYGLSFSNLNKLLEHGLIISDFNSWRIYDQLVVSPYHIPMSYAGKRVELNAMGKIADQLKIHGVSLSNVGRELYDIVDLEENQRYTPKLTNFLDRQNIKMTLF